MGTNPLDAITGAAERVDCVQKNKADNMSDEEKEIKASPELAKFFDNLLALKKYIAEQAKSAVSPEQKYICNDIYDRLHTIFKETK